ncbi:hypothetical protein H9660_14200 [Clostridium sp. Sa3CUN1]|uniref:Uncharacterized protein n=1 Tax=Clostridium gallinarum TaxID=2762246 RepID=A0ABR8Q787_9CLOT|nr:DUF5592 family protein [Clostridium gallinarum]MBD7916295.1 hypothetical protein [Clostridium gallinarum]
MFSLPKEIYSDMKFTKNLYLFDLVFLGGFLIAAWMTSYLVYPPLVTIYYIFMGVMGIIFTSKSSSNPNKRKFQSIYFALIRNRKSYIRY